MLLITGIILSLHFLPRSDRTLASNSSRKRYQSLSNQELFVCTEASFFPPAQSRSEHEVILDPQYPHVSRGPSPLILPLFSLFILSHLTRTGLAHQWR
jgi:hypothetical protein